MALDLQQQRQQAHAWLDQLPPAKLGAVHTLLEVMVDEGDDEEMTEEDMRALRASGGPTIPFEQLVEELGFTMEQVRTGTLPPGKA